MTLAEIGNIQTEKHIVFLCRSAAKWLDKISPVPENPLQFGILQREHKMPPVGAKGLDA